MPTKLAKNNANERMVEFIITMLNSPRPVPFEFFKDTDRWGNEKTFRVLRSRINQIWEEHNQCPFVEMVNEDGVVTTRGPDLFIKLVDPSVRNIRSQRYAVMPAFMQMLQSLKGTILADEFKPLYEIPGKTLSKSEKQYLNRTEKKFYCFNKGEKSYASEEMKEVIDEIYDALLSEKHLEIEQNSEEGVKKRKLVPLTLVMFNSGLYLLCKFVLEDGSWSERVYRFAVESLLSARSVRTETFKYPNDFDPQKEFDGQFGFISGKKEKFEVVLEYPRESWVHEYLSMRRWTGQETYVDIKKNNIRFKMEVSDLREVVTWVLPFAHEVAIVAPEVLRQEIENRGKEIIAKLKLK